MNTSGLDKKTINERRYAFYWANKVVAWVVPLSILSVKYDLFQTRTSAATPEHTGVVLTLFGGAALLGLLFSLWGDLTKHLSELPDGHLRSTGEAIKKTAPWVLLTAFAVLAATVTNDVLWILGTVTGGQVLGIGLEQQHDYYRNLSLLKEGVLRVRK